MPKTFLDLFSAVSLALLALCVAVPLTIWLAVMIKALGSLGAALALAVMTTVIYLFGGS